MKKMMFGVVLFIGLTLLVPSASAQSLFSEALQTVFVKALQISARVGDPTDQFNLGQLYREGKMIEQDNVKAAYWYNKAAVQGYAYAQYNLGVCYQDGMGVQQNSSVAVMWFHKAALQGSAAAQHNLAVSYATGEGIVRNESQAFEWFLKAANQGMVEAQVSVAKRYASGTGVLRDIKKAYFWYSVAAVNGSLIGRMTAGGLEKELTVFEIAKIKQKLGSWHPVVVLPPPPLASATEAFGNKK